MQKRKTITENNLTKGNVLRILFTFSLPFIAANLIQALYGAVDLFVIGRYCSPESVAAVSTGTQVTQIITSMITGLTLGSTILVGKYTGMQAEEDIKKTIGTTLTIFAAAALILTAAMLLAADPILKLLKTPAPSFDLARTYVKICFCGIFFICGYNAISAILRGYGDSRSPMLFIALSCALNIIGDFALVKGAGLGVSGAALATILSQTVSAVWVLATIGSQAVSMIAAILYLNRRRFIFTFRLQNLRIDWKKAKELATVGIPISLQECMVRLSFLYLTSITNRLGIYAASAVGVASKYDIFAMLPATSIANALTAITAQNYGAGKPERARKSLLAGLTFALAASSLFWLWAQLSPQTMIAVFSQDPAIIKTGIPFFTACSYDYLAVTLVFCMNGYLNGRSQTIFTMISSCFGALILRIPLIYLVSTHTPDNLTRIGSIAPAVSFFMAAYTSLYLLHSYRHEKRAMSQSTH